MESNDRATHSKLISRRAGSNKRAMEKMIAIRNAAYERGGRYLCELCGYAVETAGGFNSHLTRTHEMRLSEYKMAVALKKPNISKLPIVEKPPAGSKDKHHLLSYGRQNCELCDWTGVTYNAFAGHVTRTHNLSVSQYRKTVNNKT